MTARKFRASKNITLAANGVTAGKVYDLTKRLEDIQDAAGTADALGELYRELQVLRAGRSVEERDHIGLLGWQVALTLTKQGNIIQRLTMDALNLVDEMEDEVREAQRKAIQKANPQARVAA